MEKNDNKMGLRRRIELVLKNFLIANRTTIDEFLNLELNYLNNLKKFLKKEYTTSFKENDIQNAKLKYVAYCIAEKKEPYNSYFVEKVNKVWNDLNIKVDFNSVIKASKEFDINDDRAFDYDETALLIEALKSWNPDDYRINTECVKSILAWAAYSIQPGYPINNETIYTIVSDFLYVDDIRSEKMYEKYKNKRVSDLINFIELKKTQELGDFFYVLFHDGLKSYLIDCDPRDMYEDEPVMYDMLANMDLNEKKGCVNLDKYATSMDTIETAWYYHKSAIGCQQIMTKKNLDFIEIDKSEFLELFDDALEYELILNLHRNLYEETLDSGAEWTLSNITRMATFKDYDKVIDDICHYIYEGLLNNYISKLLIDFLDNPNNGNNKELIAAYDHEISQLKKDNLDFQNDIKNLNTDKSVLQSKLSKALDTIDSKEKIISSIKKDISNDYQRQIVELNKKIAQLSNENEKLKKDNVELDEIRNSLLSLEDEKEEELDFSKIDLGQFKNCKYVFVGGRFEVLNKLENIFQKAKFYHTKPVGGYDLNNIDLFVIFPKNINHAIYYEVIDLAKKYNIPFMFSMATNFENVIKDVYTKKLEL